MVKKEEEYDIYEMYKLYKTYMEDKKTIVSRLAVKFTIQKPNMTKLVNRFEKGYIPVNPKAVQESAKPNKNVIEMAKKIPISKPLSSELRRVANAVIEEAVKKQLNNKRISQQKLIAELYDSKMKKMYKDNNIRKISKIYDEIIIDMESAGYKIKRPSLRRVISVHLKQKKQIINQ